MCKSGTKVKLCHWFNYSDTKCCMLESTQPLESVRIWNSTTALYNCTLPLHSTPEQYWFIHIIKNQWLAKLLVIFKHNLKQQLSPKKIDTHPSGYGDHMVNPMFGHIDQIKRIYKCFNPLPCQCHCSPGLYNVKRICPTQRWFKCRVFWLCLNLLIT